MTNRCGKQTALCPFFFFPPPSSAATTHTTVIFRFPQELLLPTRHLQHRCHIAVQSQVCVFSPNVYLIPITAP